ncbi:MFS transporter [Lachnospira pectinoschiza]|uniref:Sugar phosphate permease n=1 Tax=Lachnospira pectinoschiza TaxID=28052 RepID=A0A1G9UKA6_9FIRM|nr:MFS transporter [Lachnospira pectinoschiza]SDM60254.1 Sugar phosphate permease [Lachnospira pectinoschiza]
MYKLRQNKLFYVIAFGLIACAVYGVGAGIRSNIGILLSPMAEQCGIAYKDASLCVAVMQLVFGTSQPLFGILASRKSNRFVLFTGVVLLALSMVGIMTATSFAMLFLSLSILFGLGTGAIAFGIVLTSAICFVGKEHAMTMSGMLNASAGMVGFIFAPLINALINRGGIRLNSIFMIGVFIVLIPLSIVLTSKDSVVSKKEVQERTNLPFKEAFKSRTYLLLLAGFSTCGFHMVIIESHLFSQYISYNIDSNHASWAFSFYGIMTIVGALLSGLLSTKIDKGKLLAFYYGFRAVWVCVYLFLLPKNFTTAVLFSAGLGLTGDATVSPTSGLVNEKFDLKHVATLIGLLFLVHQIGAFFSAYLGGIFVSATGNYNTIWIIDIALCLFASSMSFMIKPSRC